MRYRTGDCAVCGESTQHIPGGITHVNGGVHGETPTYHAASPLFYTVAHSYDHTPESTTVQDGECFTCYVLACDDEANDR